MYSQKHSVTLLCTEKIILNFYILVQQEIWAKYCRFSEEIFANFKKYILILDLLEAESINKFLNIADN